MSRDGIERRHKAFQASALPTELSINILIFIIYFNIYSINKIFFLKNILFYNFLYLNKNLYKCAFIF